MDFVVVGFGLGALGVLLGVVMLGWLAPRSRRAAARVSSADDAARCQAIAAEHHATGQALLYSGGAILLATFGALASSLDDRTGALLVTTTATVAATGILVAGYLQRARNPAPPRHARSAPAAIASMVTAPPSVETPSFLPAEHPSVENAVPAESTVEGPPTADFPADNADGEVTIVEELAPLPPATSGEDSSGSVDLGQRGGSLIAEETTDSASWRPADRATGNTSGNTAVAEVEDAKKAEDIVSTARSTRLSSSGTDEEDPSPGHQS